MPIFIHEAKHTPASSDMGFFLKCKFKKFIWDQGLSINRGGKLTIYFLAVVKRQICFLKQIIFWRRENIGGSKMSFRCLSVHQ